MTKAQAKLAKAREANRKALASLVEAKNRYFDFRNAENYAAFARAEREMVRRRRRFCALTVKRYRGRNDQGTIQ